MFGKRKDPRAKIKDLAVSMARSLKNLRADLELQGIEDKEIDTLFDEFFGTALAVEIAAQSAEYERNQEYIDLRVDQSTNYLFIHLGIMSADIAERRAKERGE